MKKRSDSGVFYVAATVPEFELENETLRIASLRAEVRSHMFSVRSKSVNYWSVRLTCLVIEL
jgi:DUF971 family protein